MFKIIANSKTVVVGAIAMLLSAAMVACNEPSNGTGNTATEDTTSGVITTPPHDTGNVVTPPATNDSNVINTDSMGTSR